HPRSGLDRRQRAHDAVAEGEAQRRREGLPSGHRRALLRQEGLTARVFSAARERVKRYVSDGRSTSWTAREVSTTVHVLVLLLTLVLAGLSGHPSNAFAWSGVIVAAAIVGTVPQWNGNALRVVSVLESVACVFAVLRSG